MFLRTRRSSSKCPPGLEGLKWTPMVLVKHLLRSSVRRTPSVPPSNHRSTPAKPLIRTAGYDSIPGFVFKHMGQELMKKNREQCERVCDKSESPVHETRSPIELLPKVSRTPFTH